MRRNILNSLMALALVSALLSCKAKRQIIKSGSPSAPALTSNKAEKLKAINSNLATYATLSIRAKTDLDINGDKNDVTMNIRINHGKAIWVSVTAIAGLEVARALITPDSVKIINRLESTYIQKPFNYIYNFANSQVNFATVESVFVGNPIKEIVTDRAELSIRGNQATLNGMVGSLAYIIRFNEMNKVLQTSLKDDGAAQNLLVDYGDFIKVQGRVMPRSVNIESQAERKNVVINLIYNRIVINETLDMPFSVPKRYTLKN